MTQALSSFQGPIPPPAILNQYGEVDRTLPNRIVAMAENQSSHRQYIEKWAVIGGTVLAYFGVICALIIALAALYGGYLLIMADHDVAGTIFGGVGLAGLVWVFIHGTKLRQEERIRKDRENKNLIKRKS